MNEAYSKLLEEAYSADLTDLDDEVPPTEDVNSLPNQPSFFVFVCLCMPLSLP